MLCDLARNAVKQSRGIIKELPVPTEKGIVTMKRALNFCKLFMWANIGTFTGRALHEYMFFKKNPGWFELNSIAWYSRLRIPFIFTVIVTVILITVRVILKERLASEADADR